VAEPVNEEPGAESEVEWDVDRTSA
jgi:hypothetical protein